MNKTEIIENSDRDIEEQLIFYMVGVIFWKQFDIGLSK